MSGSPNGSGMRAAGMSVLGMSEVGMPVAGVGHDVQPPAEDLVLADVARALDEDLGRGDVTAALLPDAPDTAYLLCKEVAVICGRPWFDACHRALHPEVAIAWHVAEGDRVRAGTVIATLEGRVRSLVTAERAALNFLQTLSGTATVTADYVAAVQGTKARILDTRKTIPGLRVAQKYAVRVGGGVNHRMGLYDAVMLKENHVRAAGSLSMAIRKARLAQPSLPLIVEVETMQQLDEALSVGCDRILIDEFDASARREAVRRAAGRIPLEVSGGVDLETVRAIAEDGVDCISIGGLTKHVRAIDLSMKLGRRTG
jgi:nicotinate-nucleotide pyrophosphorylase (carboxylating)